MSKQIQLLAEQVYRHRAMWAIVVWFGAVLSIEFVLNAITYVPPPGAVRGWLFWATPIAVAATTNSCAVLASLWTGLGVGAWPWRIVIAFTTIGLLAVVQSSPMLPVLIVFYSLIWIVWVAIGWWVRWRWRRVWRFVDRSADLSISRTTIKGLLIVMAVLAGALGLGGWLLRREPIEEGIYSTMTDSSFAFELGFSLICLLVASASLFPVLVAMLPIHPQPLCWRRALIGAVVSIALVVLANGLTAYPHYSQAYGQVSFRLTILTWLVSAAVQVLTIVLSVAWLHWAGYRLIQLPSLSTSEATLASTPINP